MYETARAPYVARRAPWSAEENLWGSQVLWLDAVTEMFIHPGCFGKVSKLTKFLHKGRDHVPTPKSMILTLTVLSTVGATLSADSPKAIPGGSVSQSLTAIRKYVRSISPGPISMHMFAG
jgi:hypothetical protein